MNPLGIFSKFLRIVPRQNFQVVRRSFVDKHGDEDIKWQWSVRESPCQECHKLTKKKGWLRMFRKKKETEELTNRHYEHLRKPKIWEWEYYDYLLPQCTEKLADETSQQKSQSSLPCGDSERKECQGKQILIHIGNDHHFQKHCAEELKFDLKEPFGLKEVCGKLNGLKGTSSCSEASSSEEEKKEKDDFCCLNNLIDENKQEEDKSKSSKCD